MEITEGGVKRLKELRQKFHSEHALTRQETGEFDALLEAIIARHCEAASPAAPTEGPSKLYRPIPDCRRALAESVEQVLRNGFGKSDSLTDTWEKRVGVIESALNAYGDRIAVEASPAAPTVELDYDILLQAADHLSQLGGGPMEDRLRLLHAALSAISPAPNPASCGSPYHRPTSIYCLDCLPEGAPLSVLLLSNRPATETEIQRGLELEKAATERKPTCSACGATMIPTFQCLACERKTGLSTGKATQLQALKECYVDLGALLNATTWELAPAVRARLQRTHDLAGVALAIPAAPQPAPKEKP